MGRARWQIAVVCAGVLCCGRSAEQPSQSGGPPAATYRLAVSSRGAGTVTSAPAGIDCGTTCVGSFTVGSTVALSAIPAAGSYFTGWGGACSGRGGCSVVISNDASVDASFDTQPPPPPGTYRLSVASSGSGTVTSWPSGIDCGTTCVADFPAGTNLFLSATPMSGSFFAGWGTACSGHGQCPLLMTHDASVEASFETMPPTPSDCVGLLPPSLDPPVVAAVPDGSSWCGFGISDDGNGNYALAYLGGSILGTFFVTIDAGKAVEIGKRSFGPVHGSWRMFSQPSGFTRFELDETTLGTTLRSWSHEGTPSSVTVLSSGLGDGYLVRVAVAPAGGTAVVRSYKDVGDVWHTVYRRFGKTGQAETGEVSLGMDHLATQVAVNLAGHVLVLAQGMKASRSNLEGKWVSRDGTALTDWFEIPWMPIDGAQFLVDGSMVASHWGELNGQFADLQTTVSPLPDWLAERRNNRLAVIRGGKGYGSWGSDSKCGAALEVLTGSGQGCGCIGVPGLSPPGVASLASIGRDGSLIVPRQSDDACSYDLYPQLLR